MWAEHVVSRTNLRRGGPGQDPALFSMDLRLNWSRSIPMSCVAEVLLRVDGEAIAPQSITLTQGGEELALTGWAARDDVWWPVLDPTTVSASTGKALSAGPHRIDVELRVRVPGFRPGPDGVWPTRLTRATVVNFLPAPQEV